MVLTRPVDFVKKPEHFRAAYTRVLRAYPQIVEELEKRAQAYNQGVEKARALEKAGKAILLAPTAKNNTTAFTKNRQKLEDLYREGYEAAQKALLKLAL